jgi:methylenetetrahydrofolate dehydrogenase (NADP+)/methenyltetrahydrofolate cyclohydrolase
MISEGVHIIDVGINRIKDNSEKGYRLVGDVDYESILGIAGSITPVPGGVGPLTITMLLYNTVLAAKNIRP